MKRRGGCRAAVWVTSGASAALAVLLLPVLASAAGREASSPGPAALRGGSGGSDSAGIAGGAGAGGGGCETKEPCGVPPAAVAMSSWSFLKSSVSKVARQVQQVLLVQSDMGRMREDLSTQEKAWHAAKDELENQIAADTARQAQLQEQVSDGAHVDAELDALRQQLAAVRAQSLANQASFQHWKEATALEDHRLRLRVVQLQELKNATEEKGRADLAQARGAELFAQAEAAAVEGQLRAANDTFVDTTRALRAAEVAGNATSRELNSQLGALLRLVEAKHQQVLPTGFVDSEIAEARRQLDQEALALAEVQREVVEASQACGQQRGRFGHAVETEREKAARSQQLRMRVCDPASRQRDSLESTLNALCHPPTRAQEGQF